MKKIIAIILYILVLASSADAQNYYIRLTDASGINTDPYQVELEAAAKDLVLAMPKEVQDSFKVFDLGSYLLQEKTDSTYLGFFNLAKKKAASLSKYYLLIGKKSSTEGVFTDFEVDLVLPTTGRYVCADNSDPNWRKNLKKRMKKNLLNSSKNLFFDKAVVQLLLDFKSIIGVVNCTNPIGDLGAGFEFYKGATTRENIAENQITITYGEYYYILSFDKPVTLDYDQTINYDNRKYSFLRDNKSNAFSRICLSDSKFNSKQAKDGSFVSDSIKNLEQLKVAYGNSTNWQVKLENWGKYSTEANLVKDIISKHNDKLVPKRVYFFLSMLSQFPATESVSSNP